MKLPLFFILLAAACLIAGAYGALHNQISYTVCPDYFHAFKFDQFDIPEHLHGRAGAAIVGWMASWWMGILIAVPILLVALIIPGWRAYSIKSLQALGIVTATALVVGLGALMIAFQTITDPSHVPGWVPEDVTDRIAFARAGTMHNFSYLGGLIGIVTGSLFLIAERIRLAMRARAGRLGALLLAACVLASCGPPLGTVEHRVPGNLLGPEVAVECYGAIREQRLTDGKIPAPGAPVDDFVAALFLVPDARVTWDFGRPTRIDAVQLGSDDPGTDCLSWSLDGERFTSIPLSAPAGEGKIRTRQATELGLTVRCLRLRPPQGGGGAFAELLAFAKRPAAFPVVLAPQRPPTLAATSAEIASRIRLIDWIKVGIGLGAIAVVLLLRRAGRAARVWVALALIAIGLGAYTRFGWFGGNGKILHPHDALHYYLGSKYFDELGHRELYRALATHERTHGRGLMVDRGLVRNLDDNRVHPGRWTDTPEGALRARFTPERRDAFARDTDAFRRLFVLKSFHRVSIDHGYNATPYHTAWLSAVTQRVAPSRGAILVGAGLDIALLVVAVLAILWAFGPGAAAVAALLLGLGEPWSFSWTGGSFARALWIALLCGGYALLARRREVAGTVLLSAAGLLRLFPLVFLGALGVFAVTRALRGTPDARRTLVRIAASAAATLAAGTALVCVTLGPGVFVAAWANARIHASLPPGNHLGLRALLMHDAPAASLTAITGWQLAVWVAALALALVLLVQRARQSETLWEALPWAAPLLFASIPLSGYDYMWLIVLAPLAAASPLRFTILVGLATLTALLAQSLEGLRPTYLAYNAVLTVALVLFFWPRPRRIAERDPTW